MASQEFVSNTIAALEEIRTELGKLGQSDAKIDELKQYIDARLSSVVPGVPSHRKPSPGNPIRKISSWGLGAGTRSSSNPSNTTSKNSFEGSLWNYLMRWRGRNGKLNL